MDHFLSHLDSLLLALSQRTMNEKQLDRYGQLLQRGELDALERLTISPAEDGSPADAA